MNRLARYVAALSAVAGAHAQDLRRPVLELLDDVRAIDGVGNNVAWPERGSAGIELRRWMSPDYGDGFDTPSGAERPSARWVSNIVCAQLEAIENRAGVSDFVWQWGQFLDHDIDLTEGASILAEAFPVHRGAGVATPGSIRSADSAPRRSG